MQRVLVLLCVAGSAAIALAIPRLLDETDRRTVRTPGPTPSAMIPVAGEEPPAEIPVFP